MRIDFEQSGGFANATFRYSADLEALPPGLAKELRELIEAARLPAAPPPSSPGVADALSYRLRVVDGPDIAAWQGSDTDMPESLAPLIDRLAELAVEEAKRR